MRRFGALLIVLVSLVLATNSAPAAEEDGRLPGTAPLAPEPDRAARMLDGFERFLRRELDASVAARQKHWKRDFSSRAAYEASVAPNRERLRRLIGAVDPRLPYRALEYVSDTEHGSELARTARYTVHAVRWPVFEGVYGEGLLLQPSGKPRARVVALPDADQTPEMLAGLAPGIAAESQYVRRLAERGCQVVVPTLIDRSDDVSGDSNVWFTNQPHREWVYRSAYEMGRHVIGYEVQKVLALVDWFRAQGKEPVGVAGYAEGGLIAFYSAAVDPRIDAALVSGYFDSRQNLADEPIYRNVWGLLEEFGDAEIATLIAPRKLLLEYSEVPRIDGPPAPREGRRAYAAPGVLKTPAVESVQAELTRLMSLVPAGGEADPPLELLTGEGGKPVPPGIRGLSGFSAALGLRGRSTPDGAAPRPAYLPDARERQRRQVMQLVEHTQRLLARCEDVRRQFWSGAKTGSVAEWQASTRRYRDHAWDEIVGRFPPASLPMNPRSRKLEEHEKWTAYEVVLDVWPDVFATGWLLVPKGIAPGDRRPVVVCQHGLEGQPSDVVTDDPKSQGFTYYQSFAARLADRGFVTFAPQNFYRGGNRFRQLQRIANPLKKTLFGITVRQHERILEWLATLPFVDPERMAFYGLSYGGNTAVRVPALLERYAAVISSGDFNEWIRKSASAHDLYSFPFYNAYEVFEFDLGHTFGHADLAGLIAPRPFMVERGHQDGVAPDEWVAYEYAKVRRLYDTLGIGDRTEIEFFNGPHMIHAEGTFAFLHRHLRWPPPK